MRRWREEEVARIMFVQIGGQLASDPLSWQFPKRGHCDGMAIAVGDVFCHYGHSSASGLAAGGMETLTSLDQRSGRSVAPISLSRNLWWTSLRAELLFGLPLGHIQAYLGDDGLG